MLVVIASKMKIRMAEVSPELIRMYAEKRSKIVKDVDCPRNKAASKHFTVVASAR